MKPEMKNEIDQYIKLGVPTCGFLEAVIENDLKESFGRADEQNRHDLFEIISYLYEYAPGTCWGSYEKRDKWIKGRGLQAFTKTILK